MKFLIKNNYGVFFIGFFFAFGDTIFGDYELIASIIGFSLMLFSFYVPKLKTEEIV